MSRAAQGARTGAGASNRQNDWAAGADTVELVRVHVETRTGPAVLRVLIDGEVDFCTLAQLGRPLRNLVLDDGVLVQLDLTQLRFADVAAVRQLGRFARHARHTGHRVTTRGASRTLRKVATLLGVADDLGFA